MPRDPRNNPTERIGRILEAVEELQLYAAALVELIPEGVALPSPPILEAIIQERTLRQCYLGHITAARSNSQKKRLPKDMEEREAGISNKAKADLRKLLDEL